MDDTSTASWHLIQHLGDLKRHEPRNVGVVLRTPEGEWLSRFFASDDDGRVDGRRLRGRGMGRDAYEAWLSYFTRKMHDDAWSDVLLAVSRRQGSFTVTEGGRVVEPAESWRQVLDELYGDLVDDRPPSRQDEGDLRGLVRQLLAQADIEPEINPSLSVDFGQGHRAEVGFDFAYTNGQRHLMQVVALGGASASDKALAFNARANAVLRVGLARSFVAFYDGQMLEAGDPDALLAPIEAVATSVDVSEHDTALDTLTALVGHSRS